MSAAHIAAGLAALTHPAAPDITSIRLDNVLGTSLDVVIVTAQPSEARAAAIAIRAEIDRLDRLLSAWRPDSEITRVNHSASSSLSPDVFAVIKAAGEWRVRSRGAFDERLGGVASLWNNANSISKTLMNPSKLSDQLAAARAEIHLDHTRMRLTKAPGIALSLDGIAKGYIIDAALTAARRAAPGLQGLMIDIGGDIRCWGKSPDGSGWKIGITGACIADNASPVELIRIDDRAVATSGTGARDIEFGGRRYSHLLSPSTGLPIDRARSATAVARTAMDADALATALAVMSPQDGAALVKDMDDAEASVLMADGSRWSSDGWSSLVVAQSQAPTSRRQPSSVPQQNGGWPSGFELRVQYEIPRVTRGPVRRPYVAIWITDRNGRAVRTLMLLGTRPYYQNSNYRWWRQQRDPRAMMDSMARPTRAPGRYTSVWDGTDDDGKAVDVGTYTVHVEASRQFGGRSIVSREVEIGATPFQDTLPPDDELGRTIIDFGRAK